MSSLLSSFGFCFWWFLAGILLGWLLNRCLYKYCCKPTTTQEMVTKENTIPATPVAKLAETPKTSAPVTAKPKITVEPKAVKPKITKPKAAKPKTTPKTAGVDIAAAKKAGFTIKNANDMTVVEGIGPKINDLFNDNGIKTFAQLAKATVPQMRAILDKGGSRFRIANPSTWAQQGALAAENKWPELKTLQDKLSAGVKK